MKDEKRLMEIDRVAYAIILNSLVNMKNELKNQDKETDLVDKVIVKVANAPSKNKGLFHKKREIRNETR